MSGAMVSPDPIAVGGAAVISDNRPSGAAGVPGRIVRVPMVPRVTVAVTDNVHPTRVPRESVTTIGPNVADARSPVLATGTVAVAGVTVKPVPGATVTAIVWPSDSIGADARCDAVVARLLASVLTDPPAPVASIATVASAALAIPIPIHRRCRAGHCRAGRGWVVLCCRRILTLSTSMARGLTGSASDGAPGLGTSAGTGLTGWSSWSVPPA